MNMMQVSTSVEGVTESFVSRLYDLDEAICINVAYIICSAV